MFKQLIQLIAPLISIMGLKPESIQVEDKIYSAEQIAKVHPGGELFVRAFAGRDATQAFLSYHRRSFPHSRVKDALEGIDESAVVDPNTDFLELCERVDKVLPRMKSFAPWHYYIKASFIWGTSIALEVMMIRCIVIESCVCIQLLQLHMHYHQSYPWWETALLGFFYALIGLNIQHDANHGALSRRAWVNRFWGEDATAFDTIIT